MNNLAVVMLGLALSAHGPEAPSPAMDSVWILIDASAAAGGEDREKEILRQAESIARERLEGREADVERLYALAAVLGLRANVEGGRTKIRVASELSTRLEEILALDPDHAGARHMLGRLHAAVRRMGGVTRWLATNLLGGDALKKATWAAAEENLLFAERREPGVPDHHLQLALLYRDTDRPELAAEELAHVRAATVASARDVVVLREAEGMWAALQQ